MGTERALRRPIPPLAALEGVVEALAEAGPGVVEGDRRDLQMAATVIACRLNLRTLNVR